MIRTPSTSSASFLFSLGTIQLVTFCTFASDTIERIPGTFLTCPSNPSSPMIIQSFILLFCCKTPSDVRIATAIGRSNDAPLFLIVAGERLITTRFAGNSRPEFRTADRTRSAASFTSDDRYPTM